MKTKIRTIIIAFLMIFHINVLFGPESFMTERQTIDHIINLFGEHHNLQYFFYFYSSIIWYESEYKQNITNYNAHDNSYDIGIAQLNSRYFKDFAKAFGEFNPYNIFENLYIGCSLFVDLLKRFNGNYVKAVYAYNCGENAVRKHRIPDSTKKYGTKVLMRAAFLKSLDND